MNTSRKSAKVIAILYFTTWVTSIAGLLLYGPILKNSNYFTGSTPNNHILLGALLEILCAVSIVGTGVALFPYVRRHSEAFALGYAALRTLEAGVIAVGVLPLLTLVSMRKSGGAAAGATELGNSLVSMHNWSFLLGPSFLCAADTAVLAFILLKSGLVARFIPLLGLFGATLLATAGTLELFGSISQSAPSTAAMAMPTFAWEISLASYLFFKGFRSRENSI